MLTKAQIVEVRQLYASGFSYGALSRRFNVSKEHIIKIISGKIN